MREPRIDRRRFLGGGASALAASVLGLGCGDEPPPYEPADGWSAGPLRHLIPAASHERFRIKASFREPLAAPPALDVAGRRARATPTDSTGRFFAFDVRGLESRTRYELRIFAADETPLCDPWPLSTLPHPDAPSESVRILCFTCAGGPELRNPISGEWAFLPLGWRRRLLARGLAEAPDVAIANGDHVYWDQRGRLGNWLGDGPIGWWRAGRFDRDAPIAGTANETVLQRVGDEQIADLYGTLFRSLPTTFLQDDHDYFENDEASDELRTFPKDAFMEDAARTTQRLYYPEGFAAPDLPGAYTHDGLAPSYAWLRFGRLFEALLYDCRGGLGNPSDPNTPDAFAGFVPSDVEAWLTSRTQASDATHLVHMPSTPILWTAGKWGEWYPDQHDAEGRLSVDAASPYWSPGWKAQHDRLLAAHAARRDRIPLFVSGDLHSTALGAIFASGDLSFRDNPVVSLLCGTPGTAGMGWPSRFRGQRATPSGTLVAEEWVEPIEENGFSILDVARDHIDVAMFRWTPEEGVDAIENLRPFETRRIERPQERA